MDEFRRESVRYYENGVWGEWGLNNYYRENAEYYEEYPDEIPDVCVANSDGTFSRTYHLEDGTIELGSYDGRASHYLYSHTESVRDRTPYIYYTIVLPQ